MSMFQDVPMAPTDPILGITTAFKASGAPDKINVGVGAYRTEEAVPLVLDVVKKAESIILEEIVAKKRDREYLPIDGNAKFCAASAKLAFGDAGNALADGRVAVVQALSGTGSLRIGAEFCARFHPVKTILVPNPTWGNHNKIFPDGGLAVQKYSYYNNEARGLDFDNLLKDLEAAPEGAVVLLHACAHNPTGCDPTMDQWRTIMELCKKKKFLPFFDSAYQGFASGDLEADAAALRMFVTEGMEVMLAQSYAKNMGLYADRIGALSVVCKDAESAAKVKSQLKNVIRPMYSSPPHTGATIVEKILTDEALYTEWKVELAAMADRIKEMRDLLKAKILELGTPGNWDHIVTQIGMFSYTGLTKSQSEMMTSKHEVYLTLDGRISMAGVTKANVGKLGVAIDDCIRNG